MRFLVTADLHLGRRGTHVPPSLRHGPFRAAAVWDRCVEAALKAKVDHVLLAGDVLDRRDRYFEALGPFERGCAALAEKGISIWMVAGNHDGELLDAFRKASAATSLHILGADGLWERVELADSSGRPRLRLLGWSFPRSNVTTSPLVDLPALPEDDLPCLGLVHGEVGPGPSRYAPLAPRDLLAAPVDLWIVGHTHAPSLFSDGDRSGSILVPGSPMAFDPGEPGPHGPWMVELDDEGFRPPEQLPLSPLRFENLRLDLAELDDSDPAVGLPRRLRSELRRIAEEASPCRLLVWRIVLEGRVPAGLDPGEALRGLEELQLEEEGITGRIDALENRLHPAIDLRELARGKDLPAVVASLLLNLESGDPLPDEDRSLLDEVERTLDGLVRHRLFASTLDGDRPPRHGHRERLHRAAWTLLDALLRQGGDG